MMTQRSSRAPTRAATSVLSGGAPRAAWVPGVPDGHPPGLTRGTLPAGYAVASGRGDLHGDGYADVASVARSCAEASVVLLGGPAGPRWGWRWGSPQAGGSAPMAAIVGDIDVDGYDELALTEPPEDGGRVNQATGVVLLCHGGSGGQERAPG